MRTRGIGPASVLLGVLAVGLAACSAGGDDLPSELTIVEPAGWAEVFDEFEVTGTFALRDVGSSTTEVHDARRASTPRIPASTFKILNSLIILETGTVGDVDEITEWDGVDRGVDVWNRDHSLRTGIDVSAVWMYQSLAREVGDARMAEWVEEAGYGNRNIGGGIDQFWLDGDLRISPLGQLEFLERLVEGDLPFAGEAMTSVRDILVRAQGDGWRWSHKTGTALAEDPQLGWLVGITEYDDRVAVFAMNLDLDSAQPAGSQIDPLIRQRVACRLLVGAAALPDDACESLDS